MIALDRLIWLTPRLTTTQDIPGTKYNSLNLVLNNISQGPQYSILTEHSYLTSYLRRSINIYKKIKYMS